MQERAVAAPAYLLANNATATTTTTSTTATSNIPTPTSTQQIMTSTINEVEKFLLEKQFTKICCFNSEGKKYMFLSALKSGIRRAGRKEAGDVIAKLEKGIDQVFGDLKEGV